LEQFKKGKHALAWAAMEAMATIHYLDMPDLPHAILHHIGRHLRVTFHAFGAYIRRCCP
jgi:hypothetical protein